MTIPLDHSSVSPKPSTPEPEHGERRLGIHVLVGILLAVSGWWIFGTIMEEVLDNDTLVRLDIWADAWVHAHITLFGTSTMAAISQLGSTPGLAIVAAAATLVLFRQRRFAAIVAYMGAYLGGVAIEQTIKRVVHRQRPAYGAQFLHGQTFSFPSGHSMGAMTVYGTAAFLLLHQSRITGWRRRAIYGVVAILILMIGISRVYLGVHYPSDVVGGFAAGAGWAGFCVALLKVGKAADKGKPAA